MRVVVFGGRDFTKRSLAFRALDRINDQYGITVVIDGMAKGADTLAHEWAKARGVDNIRYPADWAKYGRSAGPIRNKAMIEEGKPEMGVAFPGGRGTDNMKMQMKKAGIKILNVVPAGV